MKTDLQHKKSAYSVESETRTVLAQALSECPGLGVHLHKILDRYDRRGELSGTLKLGDASLPVDELRALRHLFGQAIKTSRRGEHKLDLTRFLEHLPDTSAWINELYQALNRPRRNLKQEDSENTLRFQKLVDQLHLRFPEQAPIQYFLRQTCKRHTGLSDNDFRGLRERWFKLGETVDYLRVNRDPIGLSDLGAKFFQDSKVLRKGKLYNELCTWLNVLESEGLPENSDPGNVLSHFGVTENLTSIKVTFFGLLRYQKAGVWYDWPCGLRENGESCTLSLDNLAGMEAVEFMEGGTVITCENETPFNNLIRENSSQPVIYTAGFPNSAVQYLLRKLSPDTRIQHWGDSDRAGLQIASILGRIRTVSLWRCDVPELKGHCGKLRPTTDSDRQAIHAMLEEYPDHPFAAELRFTADNGWLEQESWQPSS